MSLRSVLLATATLCAYVADAHVKMTSPIPYSVDKVDTSPISGQQFPCNTDHGFTVSTMNTMKVGEKQTLKLAGSAVHGGGSCQLSVTTDTVPTANSKFKVIMSMEGGCPNTEGEAKSYDFTLPDSIPNGKATFAWTWFSKMSGVPELYMNCAPIEVTGGASDTSKFDALPDMFKANIGEGCKSTENSAIKFPDPGTNVLMGGTNDLKPPIGNCGATGTTPADPSSPAGSGAPVSSAAGGQASAAPSSAGGNNGMYTPPAGSGATSAAATSAAAAPTSAAGGASTPAAVPTSAAGGASGGASAPAATSKPAATSAAVTSGPGGIFAPGASSAAPVASTQTTLVTVTGTPSTPIKTTAGVSKPVGTAPVATATAPAAGTGTSGAAPTSAPAAGGSGSGTTCSTNGAVVCNGPSQFGLCNNGSVVFMPVAAGTTCTNGVISKRAYNGRVVRRNRRSLIGHVHKH